MVRRHLLIACVSLCSSFSSVAGAQTRPQTPITITLGPDPRTRPIYVLVDQEQIKRSDWELRYIGSRLSFTRENELVDITFLDIARVSYRAEPGPSLVVYRRKRHVLRFEYTRPVVGRPREIELRKDAICYALGFLSGTGALLLIEPRDAVRQCGSSFR